MSIKTSIHPTFWSFTYKNYFIRGKIEENKEEILVYLKDFCTGIEVKSIHAAKCLITRQINSKFSK